VWNVVDGRQLYAVEVERVHAQPLCWSPDGTRLAVASAAPGIVLFNAETGQRERTLASAADRLGTIDPGDKFAFSPDGRRIACPIWIRQDESVVRVWDTDSGKELLAIPVSSDAMDYSSLWFAADGRRLLRVDPPFRPGAKSATRGTITVETWGATPRAVGSK
jgi:WD40 repeat protein